MGHPEREYGLGNNYEVVGVPTLVDGKPLDMACINCGGRTLFAITVNVRHPLLRGGDGIGTYVGCAACPFASPMTAVAVSTAQKSPPDTQRN